MTINKEIHEIARQALIRLMRDALELNDAQQHVDKDTKIDVEYEIMDDFQAVADYIRYLLLKVKKYERDPQEEHDSKIERQGH